METIPNLRRVALAEASSFLLLLVATIVKYSSDEPIGVKILGPIHGLLFLAYVFLAVMLAKPQGWTTRQLVLILLGAVIPFGGYVVDRWLARNADGGSDPSTV